MFETNPMKKTEEILREILFELRLLNSGLESLPQRIRESLTNPAPPAEESPSDQPASSNTAPEIQRGSDIFPREPKEKSEHGFDLDAFLKDNLDLKE